jgi:two-component system, NtrC family, sensor kinase
MTMMKVKDNSAKKKKASVEDTILRVVGGPAAGREIPVKGDKVSVGRAISADISIPDTVISRTHVILVRDGDGWKIKDLGSTNGTWVQGEKIKGEAELPLKTPVRIGNTLFELYQSKSQDELSATAFDESLISYRVSPSSIESLTLIGDSAVSQVHREQQKMAAVYRVQSLLTSVSEEVELYHKILDVVYDVIPADSSYLLLYSPDEDNLTPVVGRNKKGRVNVVSENFVSRSIVDYVKEKNESILSVDAPHDERFHSLSLCGFNVHSVMCVPMVGKQKRLCGLIYLSSMQSTREYTEDDLKLLTIIAHSAGMAVENNRLIEENIRSERMAAIGVTAAGLSHYVKNILNGLEGSVSLLRMGIDSVDESLMNEAWNILSKNHKRLSTLVLDLLNLAKDDSTEKAMYNIANIVVEIVELIRSQTREDKITIEMDEDLRGSEIYAEVDSRGIHRVLLNLINNAVDAVKDCKDDSREREIAVRLTLINQGEKIIIEVEDNGAGIPEDMQEKIFEMFHTGKGDGGTGLGLAVSKRIIENHKGKISVHSTLNEGSTFLIEIPTHLQDTSTGFIESKP